MLDDAQDELKQLSKIMDANQGKYKSPNDIWKAARDKAYWSD